MPNFCTLILIITLKYLPKTQCPLQKFSKRTVITKRRNFNSMFSSTLFYLPSTMLNSSSQAKSIITMLFNLIYTSFHSGTRSTYSISLHIGSSCNYRSTLSASLHYSCNFPLNCSRFHSTPLQYLISASIESMDKIHKWIDYLNFPQLNYKP